MSFKPVLIVDKQHPQLPCGFCKNSLCHAKSDAPNTLVPWLSLDWVCYCCKAPKFGQKRENSLFFLFSPSLPGSLSSWQGIRRDTCPGGKTTPCLPREELQALTTFYGNFLPIDSWPRGRKELRINGQRTERGSCSLS